MNKSLVMFTFIFAVLSASLYVSAGFYYKDLYCDGGWYSYPALSLSRNGSPAENLEQIDALQSVHGVKSTFHFLTCNSTRIFYTSLWFKYVSQNIVSLKILSLLEYILLLVLLYFLIYKFSKNHLISLLLLAILINDKRIILIVTSDYRPDIMVATFSCLSFIFFLRAKHTLGFIFAIFTSCLLILTHITSVIPFLCIICFFLSYNVLYGNYKLTDNYRYFIVICIVFTVFLWNGIIFDYLLFSSHHIAPSSVPIIKGLTIVDILSEAWNNGLVYLIKKEVRRWQQYFIFSNIFELLLFFTGIIILFKQSQVFIDNNKKALCCFFSIVTGLIAFFILDVHTTWRHGIALVPFLFLMLSCVFRPKRSLSYTYTNVLIILVWFTSLQSIIMAGQLALQGEKGGYNISIATKCFDEIINNNDKTYFIVGPTEIWPFIKEDKDVLIIDIRNGKQFAKIENIIESIDFIVINEDYAAWKFEETFLHYFPNYYFHTKFNINGYGVLLKVFKLKKKHQISSN